MIRKAFDFFLYGSLYIAALSVLMVYQTSSLFRFHESLLHFYEFIFFSTIASYNFHWLLTPYSGTSAPRRRWMKSHLLAMRILLLIGLVGSLIFIFPYRKEWFWIGLSAGMTFLYSAPKIPGKYFERLQKVAIGKTIYLALVWTYVTAALPFLLAQQPFDTKAWLFIAHRFFLVYAICILFDYRDKELDQEHGVRSLVTMLPEKLSGVIFFGSCLLSIAAAVALSFKGWTALSTGCLILGVLVLVALYKKARKDKSDFLYYFVLDGLMAFSALLTSFLMELGYLCQ